MDAPSFTGSDDRDFDADRDAPIKTRFVKCATCGDRVRVMISRPVEARVYCWTCWAHGAPIAVGGTT